MDIRKELAVFSFQVAYPSNPKAGRASPVAVEHWGAACLASEAKESLGIDLKAAAQDGWRGDPTRNPMLLAIARGICLPDAWRLDCLGVVSYRESIDGSSNPGLLCAEYDASARGSGPLGCAGTAERSARIASEIMGPNAICMPWGNLNRQDFAKEALMAIEALLEAKQLREIIEPSPLAAASPRL